MRAPIEFQSAFKLLTGNAPFPWQEALYRRFASPDPSQIPGVCDIPTGLGKTSVVAIWLLALANGGPNMARRLVYVVNRRTIVDQTTAEVECLRKNLLEQSDLEFMRDRVGPLPISTLRGQFADNREWLADPSRPAVIIGTVDMIGSRLLFNGYRAGSWQLSRHAGLIGQDALIVHDEAHLEPAFQELIEWAENRQKTDGSPRPLKVLAMSATTRDRDPKNVLSITDDDRKNEVVQKRYSDAHKHLVVHAHDAKVRKLTDQLLELAWTYADQKMRVIVFVRTPSEARNVCSGLQAKLKYDDPANRVALLTGTIRGYEREKLFKHPAVQGLLHGRDDNGSRVAPEQTTWLVSTSAGEVGADFDADHLVCDLAPIDSMIQRFGRVNRRGGSGRIARIDVVLDLPVPKKDKSGNPKELDTFELARLATAELLAKLPPVEQHADVGESDSTLKNASPSALRELVGNYPEDYERSASPKPPHVTPHDVVLDAWALTSIQEDWPLAHDVHPYLHGLDKNAPETVVAWRVELDEIAQVQDDLANELRQTISSVLKHYPLQPMELLRDKPSAVAGLIVALRERHPQACVVLAGQRSLAVPRLKDLPDDKKLLEDRLKYQSVILPTLLGGLSDAGSIDTDSVSRVLDVADFPPLISETNPPIRRRVLLTRTDDDQWHIRILGDAAGPGELTNGTQPEAFSTWQAARDQVTATLSMHCAAKFVLAQDDNGQATRMLLLCHRSDDVERRPDSRKIGIEEHNLTVQQVTQRTIEALSLEAPLKQAFLFAASLHDCGKADPRWQQAIGNADPAVRFAKSIGKGFKWTVLDGYRHEFGSLYDAVARLDEVPANDMQELALHLIAAHHGRGRPHFEHRAMSGSQLPGDELPAQLQPAAVAQRFARLQRRFGHWGLAWLESILMAADAEGSAAPVEIAPDEFEEAEE
jgi:CRISPR-associated endonuclease/helicase Cas3